MTNNSEIPDFSGDDLGHHKEIQQARAERKAYEQMVTDSLFILKNELGIESAPEKDLSSFLMFNSRDSFINQSFESHNPNIPLSVFLVEYESAFPIHKNSNSGTDEYLFGYLTFKQSYPKTYLCKETLKEKITDLLLKSDIDFEHSRKFSGKFHVVTEDKERLLQLMLLKKLDDLVSHPELELELNGNTCLFRNSKKPVSPEEAAEFAELARLMMKTLM
jgi:hypothetical protein